MKETAEQSAELKQAFKRYFKECGYNASLPEELEREKQAFPLEWSEACEEWEKDGE